MKNDFRKNMDIEAGTIFPDIDMPQKSAPHRRGAESSSPKNSAATSKNGKNKRKKNNA